MRDPRPLKELEPIYFLVGAISRREQGLRRQTRHGRAVVESEDLLIVHKNELLLHVNINQFFTKVCFLPSVMYLLRIVLTAER